ncbi:hypothetical protein NDU88_005176 [Pleurodeles waltl]|uniref:Uncharacterized protein n=1 Tax=Pleurodeles waltl TaxID=8319 RepID=A0AAV7PMX1_PLEWA|nr:hypothetical protein NDU88_005176 [Pleurodeles waltl]
MLRTRKRTCSLGRVSACRRKTRTVAEEETPTREERRGMRQAEMKRMPRGVTFGRKRTKQTATAEDP